MRKKEGQSDFIGSLQLKLGKRIKVGQKIKCINPDHNDENPSMHIYEDHAYCFSCGYLFPQKGSQEKYHTQFLLNECARNVESFYQVQPFFYDLYRNFWLWDWSKSKYCLIDDLGLLSIIDEKLKFQGSTIRKQYKQEYLDAFKLIGRRNIPKNPEPNWVQFGELVTNIRIEEHPWGKDGFEATPGYFFTNPIPWKVGGSFDTPVMDKLFKEWVGEKYVQTLYEIIAYCCIPQYPIHLVFALIGSGRNGKSVFQRILTKFLGHDNCSATELETLLGNRFESFKLYKKLACQLGETNWDMLTKTSLLKKLSGGDLIGFEQKNKDPFDDYNYAKIIINSNSLPSSNDTSEGFYRRWMIIEFPNTFPEGKDVLKTVPEEEFSNLARKCIKILPKILKEGKFHNQGSIKERRARYIAASNPFPFFIKKFCILEENEFILENELFSEYLKFLRKIKARPVTRGEFVKALEAEGLYRNHTKKSFPDPNSLDEGDKIWKSGYWIDGINVNKIEFPKFLKFHGIFHLDSLYEI